MKIKTLFRRIPKTPDQRKEIRIRLLLSLLSGVLLGIAFPPFHLEYFAFVGLVPFLFTLKNRKSLAEINRTTYSTMFVFTLITLYWVGSWTKDADPFLMMSGTALIFFNPLLFLIPSSIFYAVRKRFNFNIALLTLPFHWVTYEYLYSITDIKFPWLILGNSLSHFTMFIQIADIIGAHGLTIIIVFINVLIYKILNTYLTERTIPIKPTLILLLIFVGILFYGSNKINDFKDYNSHVKFGLIQPNINPWKKWEQGSPETLLNNYLELSFDAVQDGAQIIVWPETALPIYLRAPVYEKYRQRIFDFCKINSVSILTGMPDIHYYFDEKDKPDFAKRTTNNGKVFYTSYNSILFFQPDSKMIQSYNKMKLVPFGEKVPFVEAIPFLGDFFKWNVGISSWNTGTDTTIFNVYNSVENKNINIGAVICVESIYPDYVASFVEKGAEIIVVVTNDSWYGDSSGPYQHRDIGILRSIENRRFVIRSANGGISCFINPVGEIYKQTKMFEKGYLVADAGLLTDSTFYSKHALLIPGISLLLSLLLVVSFFIEELKNKIKENS